MKPDNKYTIQYDDGDSKFLVFAPPTFDGVSYAYDEMGRFDEEGDAIHLVNHLNALLENNEHLSNKVEQFKEQLKEAREELRDAYKPSSSNNEYSV